MAFKLVLLSALVAVAVADRQSYRAPTTQSYRAPTTQSHRAPTTQSYRAPTTQSYRAPTTQSYSAPAPAYGAQQQVGPAKYEYNWAVKDDYSGNDFGAQEARDGYDTQGSYYVQLPDGRLQEVTYYVNGDSGFVAEVNYQGEAQYAQQQSYGSAPSHQQPRHQSYA